MSKWKKVSDFITFSTKGITPKYVEKSVVIVLNQKCIRNNIIDYSFAQYCDESKIKSDSKFVNKGDILINSTGAGTAGRCAFVAEIPEGFKLITDSHVLLLRCNSYYEAKCLNYVLFSFESTLMSFMTGSSGQSELDKVVLFNIKTQMPTDCKTQKSVSTILTNLENKIELNNRINAELESMAKTIYDYWFVQFDFPDKNGKPYKSSGGKMVWNEELKREIPEGWENGELEDIADLIRGVTYSKGDIKNDTVNGVIPILRATNISGNVIDLNNMVYVPSEIVDEKQILKKYDILFVMSSGSIDHIGKNGFYYFEEKAAFGAFCSKLVAKSNYRYYLYSYIQSDFLFQTIKNECLGTNINNLNGSLVNGFKVTIPNKQIIDKFNEIVAPIYDKIAVNQKENQQLASLRDWLLPMLMNGQIKIN
jgi:type I restriction enzyme S subunit